MKRKAGKILIMLGCGMIAAALALFLWNQQEQIRAASASQAAVKKVVEVIQVQETDDTSTHPDMGELYVPDYLLPKEETERTMTVVEIDGYGYIGYLTIAALELELPVMADWSYGQLHIAPCRYFGSIFTDDLVIMAHNYPKHFGTLKEMRAGDVVCFTDMDGAVTRYRVIALEILGANAVEEMISGDYDLTMFTCTYGGENRVAVRCDRMEE